MLINCPLSNSSKEILPLIHAGADCFYAGVTGEIIFGTNKGVSNRRNWKNANFSNLDELKKACNLVHKHKKKIFLTINAHYYTQEQIEKVITFIKKYQGLIDGFLVTDIGLMIEIGKNFPHINLIASTGTNIHNSDAVDLFKKFGIKEIVFPRHLTVGEIREMIQKNPEIIFESFIIEGDCINIDGLCRFTHGVYNQGKMLNACQCMNNFSVSIDVKTDYNKSSASPEDIKKRLQSFAAHMQNHCGACALWDLSRAGVKIVKIVGRETSLETKLLNTYFIKRASSYLHLSRAEYYKKVKLDYQKIFKKHCQNRCLYVVPNK